jgi:hypothetical protein
MQSSLKWCENVCLLLSQRSIRWSTNARLVDEYLVLEALNPALKSGVLGSHSSFALNLRGRLQHVVIYNKVHALLIGDEKHIDHAIAIDISKIENLIVLYV